VFVIPALYKEMLSLYNLLNVKFNFFVKAVGGHWCFVYIHQMGDLPKLLSHHSMD